jgi:lysophospholipase L1-like esterase
MMGGLLLLASMQMTGCKLNQANSRVAFMGDSLTESWSFPRANLGKHGQTTAEMLARFPHDVLGKGYREVVILGGTNDTLLGLDPEVTIKNLSAMADLATAVHIEPILAQIPPIYRNDRDYPTKVRILNEKIIQLAADKQLKLVDYYNPLNGHPEEYSDGVHLRHIAYWKMEYALAKVKNPF